MKGYLSTMTPEQLKEMREKGAISRQANVEWAKKEYKQDWLDEPLWIELAKEANIKLPFNTVKPSIIKLGKVGEMLGLFTSGDTLKDLIGVGSQKDINSINAYLGQGKKYNQRAYVGSLLECWKQKQKKGTV